MAAGLVKRGHDWPGLWSVPERIGRGPIEVERPRVFFRADGSMPAKAELELDSPPGFDSPAEFRERLSDELARREEQAALAVVDGGRGFLGARRIVAQDRTARPTTGEPRRGLNPRIAARDKWKRIEALTRLVEFLRAYREARAALKRGIRDVMFPAGTYWLRVTQGVRCLAPG